MTLSTEPAPPPGGTVRVAAIGDLHVGENMSAPYRELFQRVPVAVSAFMRRPFVT